jgi:hypothetical protein
VVVGVNLVSSDRSRDASLPVSSTTTAAAVAATSNAAPTTADAAVSTSANPVAANSNLDSVAGDGGDTAPKPIVDGEVTIPRQAGADIDKVPAVVKGSVVGPVGDLDLYQAPQAFRVHTGSIFLIHSGSTAPGRTYAICDDLTGPSPSYNTATPNVVVTVNAPFCFVTSAHHLAWAEAIGVQDDTQAVTMHVRVWDKTVDA